MPSLHPRGGRASILAFVSGGLSAPWRGWANQSANCVSSVDPVSASVEVLPPLITLETSSK